MATSAHYPPTGFPWQRRLRKLLGCVTYGVLLRAGETRDHDATLLLYYELASERWYWTLLPDSWERGPLRGRRCGYVSSVDAERALLRAVAWHLKQPPSALLPSQEGATDGGKVADCA